MKIIKTLFLVILILPNLSLADSFDYFRKSNEEIIKGIDLEHKISESSGEAVKTISETDRLQLIYHAKKALEYSYKVKNEDLDKMDRSLIFKSLAKNYEKFFRNGLKLYIEAWENGDTKKALEAHVLLKKWSKYYICKL